MPAAHSSLLNDRGQYQQALGICEKAIILGPCEESFHLVMLDALIDKEKYRDALRHYEYVTALYYRELGVCPSQALKKRYRKIIDLSNDDMADESVQEKPNLSESCDFAQLTAKNDFLKLAEQEQRRCQKTGLDFFVCYFTVIVTGHHSLSDLDLTAAAHHFLTNHLRKSDVFTQWSKKTFAALFPGVPIDTSSKMLQRMEAEFEQNPCHPGVSLISSIERKLPDADNSLPPTLRII